MLRHKGCVYLSIAVGCWLYGSVVLGAQSQEELFSESAAEVFVRQGREIYHQDPLDPRHIEQAMTFLYAAMAMDEASAAVPEQILKIGGAGCYSTHDYSREITWALERQAGIQADVDVLTGAVRCLLERQNSRLDREVLLEKLLRKYAAVNPTFGSDLAAQLGLLSVEKADVQNAMSWLAYACDLNRYNRLAFAKLRELSSGQQLSLKPEVYLLQLRIALDFNPYDLNNALLYADTLRQMQVYDVAARAYEYAAKLYAFLAPSKPLDEAIFWPWLLCCYQVPRQENTCIRIAEQYRDPQRFDLMLEAVAGKAAVKLGQIEKGKAILEAAGKKAELLLSQKGLTKPIYPEQLAWFYSFVLEEPDKALAWANQAYKEAPQRQGVQEIFAYALAQSGQLELAQQYAEPFVQTSQVARLTTAIAAATTDPNAGTVTELLKTTVEMSPESFVGEKAIALLKNRGSDYITPAIATSIQVELNKAYEKSIVPEFVHPQKRFSAKLLFSGSEFLYGNDFSPKLIIENISSAPLTIAPGSLLEGRVRIDAALRGDLMVEIPNLLSMQFRPSRSILPGEHAAVPLPLDTGKLRKLLLTYPQAGVDVGLTVYLDPVERENGVIENALPGTEPVQGQIHRTNIALTRDFLTQRMDVLAKGKQGQQLRAVELFTGLLAEQKAFQSGQAQFRYVQVEPSLLADSVRSALRNENWKIRIQAMEGLLSLSIPLDSAMIQDISLSLNHEYWPVRFMAMVLLAKSQPGSFQKVLDWAVQNDPSPMNQRIAAALGAKVQIPAKEEP